MAGTYDIHQSSQGHVKDTHGQDIGGLCVWCYKITYDPGLGNPADKDALDGDWKLDGFSGVLDPNGAQLTAATVDPDTVPSGYKLTGKSVEADTPAVHPTATDKAPPDGFGNVTWIEICFVVNCGEVGSRLIAVSRKPTDRKGFTAVELKGHDASNKNEKKLQAPK